MKSYIFNVTSVIFQRNLLQQLTQKGIRRTLFYLYDIFVIQVKYNAILFLLFPFLFPFIFVTQMEHCQCFTRTLQVQIYWYFHVNYSSATDDCNIMFIEEWCDVLRKIVMNLLYIVIHTLIPIKLQYQVRFNFQIIFIIFLNVFKNGDFHQIIIKYYKLLKYAPIINIFNIQEYYIIYQLKFIILDKIMSQRKKGEGSLVHTLSSFSSSDAADQALISSEFYQEFLKQNCFYTAQIFDTFIRELQNGKSKKAYAVYSISVKTSQISYNIEKRYSQFLQLYKQLQKKIDIKTEFPKKTFFSSSTEEKITEYRKLNLNKFIQEILTNESKSILVQFFQFIDIRNIYSKSKISIKSGIDILKKNDEEIVSDLLEQFYLRPQNIQQILNELENQIFDRKIKISNESIRMILIGLGKRRGILVYCLQYTQHFMICLKGLQFINKLLSFQFNRQAQMYIKVFISCQWKHFILNQKFTQFSQIKLNYFKLLEIYLKRNCDIDSQIFFNTNKEFFEQYNSWSKSREKNSINVQLFQNDTSTSAINKVQKKSLSLDLSSYQEYLSTDSNKVNWQKINEYQDDNCSLRLERFNNNFMKFTLQSVKQTSKLETLFFHSNKWNKNIQSYRVNKYLKTIEYTMKLEQLRQFKFFYEIDKTNFTIIKKHPSEHSSQDSYIEVIKIQRDTQPEGSNLNKVTILSNYLTKRSQQYFKSEIDGDTSYLFDSIKDIHYTI